MALKVGELYASFGIDSSGLDGALKDVSKKCEGIASSLTKTGLKLSTFVTAPITKAAKGMYDAGTNFYSQMSRVEGISGATAEELDALTAAAIEMGSTTSFTATDAGKALEYMAMAGWKSDQMLAGLNPVIKLAESSGEDLASVSDIVTDALTAFGLQAKDAAMFSDVLAATATNSNTNVGLMGETFKYVAPLAGAMNYSIQDTAVAIGLMANAGIKGGQAGTALRNIITNLAKPTDEVAIAMDKLGISITDTNGEVLPLEDVIGQLRKSFSGLTEAEKTEYAATLAGKYGMSGLLAIVNASEKDINALTLAIDNSEGATNKMAETMLDNAQGDVTIFRSAIEGLQITLWGIVEGPFRSIVKTATRWVDAFRNMNRTTQTTILKIAGIAAAIGPVLLIAGRLFKAFSVLGTAISVMTGPVGLIAAGFALFYKTSKPLQKAFGNLKSVSKSFFKNLEYGNGAVDSFRTALYETFGLETTKRIMGTLSTVKTKFAGFKTYLQTSIDGLSDAFAEGKEKGGIFEGINESIGYLGTLVSDGINTLSVNAINFFNGESFAKIGETMSNFIHDGFEWAFGGGKANIIQTIIDMVEGLNAEDLSSAVASLGAFIKDMIVSAITGIGDGISSLVTAFGDLLSGVFNIDENGNKNGFGANFETIFSGIGETLIDIIAGSITAAVSSASKILDAVISLLNTVDWANVPTQLLSFAQNLVTNLVSSLSDIDMSELGTSIANTLLAILNAGVELLKGLFSEDSIGLAASIIESVFQLGASLVGELLDGFLSGILGTDTNIYSTIYGVISQMFVAVIEGLKETINNFFDWVGNLISGVDKIFDFLTGKISYDDLVKSFSDTQEQVEIMLNPVMGDMPEEEKKAFADQFMTSDAILSDDVFALWGDKGTDAGNAVAQNAIDSANAYLSENPIDVSNMDVSSETGAIGDISGENWALGVMSGVNSQGSALYGVGRSAFNKLNSGFKDAADEHSPSKVGKKDGAFFGKGIILGALETLKDVRGVGSALGTAMSDGLNQITKRKNQFTVTQEASKKPIELDYAKLANAISERPSIMTMDGQVIARVNADNNQMAISDRNRRVALGYGR